MDRQRASYSQYLIPIRSQLSLLCQLEASDSSSFLTMKVLSPMKITVKLYSKATLNSGVTNCHLSCFSEVFKIFSVVQIPFSAEILKVHSVGALNLKSIPFNKILCCMSITVTVKRINFLFQRSLVHTQRVLVFP